MAISAVTVGWSVGVLMWNPHWECFVKSDECKSQAQLKMTSMLQEADFATAVMFEAPEYAPPRSHSMKETTCGVLFGGGRDYVSMFWDNTKWEETDVERTGCMFRNVTDPEQDDRPFIVKSFRGKGNNEGFPTDILMISGHFPHPDDAAAPFDGSFAQELILSIKESMAQMPQNTGVVFAADTNLDFTDSTDDILQYLGVPKQITGSTPAKTCCYNDGYQYAPDRVATNLPSVVGMEKYLHDPTPSWAEIPNAGFHKPVFALFKASTPSDTCHVGDTVLCSDGVTACAGNQCCPDSTTCPSADASFSMCPLDKFHDCTEQGLSFVV